MVDKSPESPNLPEPEGQSDPHAWKRFKRLGVDKKQLSGRVKRAESKTTKHAHRFIVDRISSIRESREHIVAWFIIVAVVLTAIWAQMMMFGAQSSVSANVAGGTYAEGVIGGIGSLNPLYASTSAEVAASRLMFSSLYSYDNTGALHPDLAKSLVVDAKATKYTLTLRDDVFWHDGEPLTANDVVFTVQMIKDPATRVRSSLAINWRDVDVQLIDKNTVQFQLPAYAAFPHALTFPIIPSHILGEVKPGALQENAFSRSPVGSGPFVFRILQNAETVSTENVVHMVANQNYYHGIPRVNRFELHAYPTGEQLAKAVKSNALSAAADLSRTQVADLDSTAYQNDSYTIDNGVYALMNNARGVFADKFVRQAVQSAIDTAEVRKSAGENVQSLYLPFISGQVDSSKLPSAPSHSLDTARSILTSGKWKYQQGVWKKGKQTLEFVITTTKNDQYVRVAGEVARQLREVGMQVTVRVVDDRQPNANFIGDVLQRRNFEMLIYELPIGADPDVYAYWHSSQIGDSGYNFTSYNNSTSDAALASARDRSDRLLRDEKYALFARQWQADAPAVGLYQQVVNYLHKPSASAVAPGAKFVISSDRYANVRNWTVSRGDVYKTP